LIRKAGLSHKASMSFSAEDIETLSRAIAHRRSLGLSRLREDPVPPEMIEKMMRAADWAPSNGDTEPWRLKFYTGDKRNILADAYAKAYIEDHQGDAYDPIGEKGYRDRAFLAPLWVSIAMTPGLNEDGTLAESEHEEMMAVACAIQNMHLVACAQGLVGMWHSKGVSVHPAVARELGYEAPSKLLGFFFCGFPNCDWPAGERKPIEGKIAWA
jgi:nitroreductase